MINIDRYFLFRECLALWSMVPHLQGVYLMSPTIASEKRILHKVEGPMVFCLLIVMYIEELYRGVQ